MMETKGKLMLKAFEGKDLFIWRDECGRDYPLPPFPFVLRETLYLKVRLQSFGNKSAWWHANGIAKECLNEAPIEPVFRGIVREFSFSFNPDEFEHRVDDFNTIVQGGKYVINFYAIAVSPVPDPLRPLISETIQHINEQGYCPCWQQGHLEIYSLLPEEVSDNLLELLYPTRRWFYNHYIYGTANFNYRVIDHTAWGVLKPFTDIIITSPDHIKDPVYLRKHLVYILKHPLPSRRVD